MAFLLVPKASAISSGRRPGWAHRHLAQALDVSDVPVDLRQSLVLRPSSGPSRTLLARHSEPPSVQVDESAVHTEFGGDGATVVAEFLDRSQQLLVRELAGISCATGSACGRHRRGRRLG
ncbi:hypothetical protein IVB38_34620 [Bradyrhizobium sp. 38]|uniref:hypothetical protein n=1 Tax=unclassified Bradyrhizobium TaxID=2631580 RepID=UPI001FFAF9A9|nr:MULTISPECIES: hypothetical protein [unclassified Bradyrhizobium]MCK1341015.1 hypothetical protein [Bradyrhizobium sp. 38]MCK1780976.1 hypothetical protein [Bradyrhizobium sp. 132]